jgi:hypothetical protein
VPGATHLFEEPGTLDEAARLAADWFVRHCTGPADDRRTRRDEASRSVTGGPGENRGR